MFYFFAILNFLLRGNPAQVCNLVSLTKRVYNHTLEQLQDMDPEEKQS